MFKTPQKELNRRYQNKNEHTAPVPIPRDAVLSDVLKSIELQLQRRGMLKIPPPHTFNPVWFLAETERNVFLWRKGCSLIQEDEFEFWIDVKALAEKRIKQLEANDPDNPFVNPLWGSAIPDLETARQEIEYLTCFLDVFEKVEAHAHALSHVGSACRKELINDALEVVVLPSGKGKWP